VRWRERERERERERCGKGEIEVSGSHWVSEIELIEGFQIGKTFHFKNIEIQSDRESGKGKWLGCLKEGKMP
jgi:hypothetical protein